MPTMHRPGKSEPGQRNGRCALEFFLPSHFRPPGTKVGPPEVSTDSSAELCAPASRTVSTATVVLVPPYAHTGAAVCVHTSASCVFTDNYLCFLCLSILLKGRDPIPFLWLSPPLPLIFPNPPLSPRA